MLVGSGETVVVGGLLLIKRLRHRRQSPSARRYPGDWRAVPLHQQKVSKRNLMLFIRPTVIRDRDEYRQASSGQYTAFNDAQSKQRGKENNDAMLSNDLLEIYPRQDTAAFRQVSAAIDAFNLGGNDDPSLLNDARCSFGYARARNVMLLSNGESCEVFCSPPAAGAAGSPQGGGMPFSLERLEAEAFEKLLVLSYQRDSAEARRMMAISATS